MTQDDIAIYYSSTQQRLPWKIEQAKELVPLPEFQPSGIAKNIYFINIFYLPTYFKINFNVVFNFLELEVKNSLGYSLHQL